MLVSQYYLKDCMVRFQSFDKQIKENTDVTILKSRFFGICFDMALAAEECSFTFGNSRYAGLKQTLLTAVGIVDESDEALIMKEQIQTIVRFFEDHDFNSPNTSDFTSNVSRAISKYSAINPMTLSSIARSITSNDRVVTVFDPRCRDAQQTKAIKEGFLRSTAYGLEIDQLHAAQAKANIDKVIRGSLTGSKISNDAFDVMFIDSPITWVKDSTIMLVIRQEKILLMSTTKYIRPGGVLVLTIPYFKMHKDICILLAKAYKDIQIRRMPGADFYDRGLITIMGQRKVDKEVDDDTYRTLRSLYNIDTIQDVSVVPFEDYVLPMTTIDISYFRGSILDEDEMTEISASSGCFESFWKAQEVEKLSENQKEPCLPFNVGQLGLVLTSGCLDGIVDEGNGNSHAIKGRVSKKTNIERDVVDGNVQVTETITNRVEINTFLPNGEYKVLA